MATATITLTLNQSTGSYSLSRSDSTIFTSSSYSTYFTATRASKQTTETKTASVSFSASGSSLPAMTLATPSGDTAFFSYDSNIISDSSGARWYGYFEAVTAKSTVTVDSTTYSQSGTLATRTHTAAGLSSYTRYASCDFSYSATVYTLSSAYAKNQTLTVDGVTWALTNTSLTNNSCTLTYSDQISPFMAQWSALKPTATTYPTSNASTDVVSFLDMVTAAEGFSVANYAGYYSNSTPVEVPAYVDDWNITMNNPFASAASSYDNNFILKGTRPSFKTELADYISYTTASLTSAGYTVDYSSQTDYFPSGVILQRTDTDIAYSAKNGFITLYGDDGSSWGTSIVGDSFSEPTGAMGLIADSTLWSDDEVPSRLLVCIQAGGGGGNPYYEYGSTARGGGSGCFAYGVLNLADYPYWRFDISRQPLGIAETDENYKATNKITINGSTGYAEGGWLGEGVGNAKMGATVVVSYSTNGTDYTKGFIVFGGNNVYGNEDILTSTEGGAGGYYLPIMGEATAYWIIDWEGMAGGASGINTTLTSASSTYQAGRDYSSLSDNSYCFVATGDSTVSPGYAKLCSTNSFGGYTIFSRKTGGLGYGSYVIGGAASVFGDGGGANNASGYSTSNWAPVSNPGAGGYGGSNNKNTVGDGTPATILFFY